MAKLVAAYEYTDGELLLLYREALAHVSQGKSYSIRGKMLTRLDVDDITRMIDHLERRTRTGSTVVTARHARR